MSLLTKIPLVQAWVNYPFWHWIHKYRRRYLSGLAALVVVDAVNVSLPLVVKVGIDALPAKNMNLITYAGVGYMVLMVVQAIGRFIWRVYLTGTAHLVARDLRLDLYRHLVRVPLDKYSTVRTGDLMSRTTNDVESIRMAVGPGILVAVDAVLSLVMVIPVMLYLSVKLTLLAMIFMPMVPFVTGWLGNKIDTLFESIQARMSRMGDYCHENLTAVRMVKSLVLEPILAKRFATLSDEYRIEAEVLAKYQSAIGPTLAIMNNLGIFFILLIGGMDVMQGAISVGTLVAFHRFVGQLAWPMEAIAWSVAMNREGTAAQRRVDEVMALPQVESQITPVSDSYPKSPVLHIPKLEFAYEDGPFKLSLSDLSLAEGSKIGIVGPVGSGKSTLFQLILRLYETQPESIYYRGRDVGSIDLHELRLEIAMVEQQITLFSETVSDNLKLGRGRSLANGEMLEALEVASVREEVFQLPHQEATILGEKGVNLSGGQKQRIAISRSLLRDPQLLLLDDCFSAVDVHVENQIIERFFKQYPKLTVMLSSHRLSVMARMDEVWVIRKGRVVDRGNHDELIKKSNWYRRLYEKQGDTA